MKSLKELVEFQNISNKSDMEIITDWFVLNEKESEGINLMNVLVESFCPQITPIFKAVVSLSEWCAPV